MEADINNTLLHINVIFHGPFIITSALESKKYPLPSLATPY